MNFDTIFISSLALNSQIENFNYNFQSLYSISSVSFAEYKIRFTELEVYRKEFY